MVQKAKFEYSSLGQVFNEGLEKDEKQSGLLKSLKNIEDKTDNQLKENKDSYIVRQELSQEAKNILKKLNNQEKLVNYRKLGFRGGNNKDYDFTNFSSLRELFRETYYGEILIWAVEREQDNFDDMIEILKVYKPKKDFQYYGRKQDLVINVQDFYDGREMIINTFKNKLFPFYSGNHYKEFKEESSESEDRIPDTSTLEQMARLDKIYPPLTSRYFMEKSIIGIMKKLKNYK